MQFEHSYVLNLDAEQCRHLIRLDLKYNFNEVVKNEVDENHFEFKGLAVKTGSIFKPTLPQIVSIFLRENQDGKSTNVLIRTVPTLTDAHGIIWRNALEQLAGIVWTDIYNAATARYSMEPVSKVSQNAVNNVLPATQTQTSFNDDYGQTQRPVKSKKVIYTVIAVVAIIILAFVIIPQLDDKNGISVVQEELVTSYQAIEGNNLYPILVLKVKNTSSRTKKVSFEANFYADGALLGSGQASYVTLAPGDEAFLYAQSNKGYVAWSSHQYSYKITKWWVFDQ